jgi:hypothetical protein
VLDVCALDKEQGFPEKMPFYFRHTSRLNREHAQALMRLRCCSDPFAACPSLKWSAAPTCPRCPGAVPETVEHVLLDCPAYAHLRAATRDTRAFSDRPSRRPSPRSASACSPPNNPRHAWPRLCTHALNNTRNPYELWSSSISAHAAGNVNPILSYPLTRPAPLV